MKRLLTYSVLAFLMVQTTLVAAQDYVVNAKGDTLQGKVKVFVNGFDKRVQVTQPDKKKFTFNILQVRSFVLEGEDHKPVKFGETYVFMKLLKQGYLSLYAFQMNGQLAYDGRYLLKLDGKGIEVPNLGFKRNMTKFLTECPKIVAQIEEGKLGYSDLNTIIDQFNQCINSNTSTQSLSAAKQENTQNTPTNLDQWNALEAKIQNSNLAEKNDALDMVKDIKNKLSKGEQIPKFLSEGLKSVLKNDEALLSDLIKNLEGL